MRVGRDWLLLAAGLLAIAVEAGLRGDVVWRPVSVLVTVAFCPTTLWRRTHPLAMVVVAFVLSVVLDDLGPSDQIGGFVALAFPAVLGASVRLWSTSRRRELDEMRSRERVQFARELHDTVAHHISAIVIRAQAGRVVTGSDPAAAVQALEAIEEEGARTLEAMRALVGALRDDGSGAPLSPRAGVADLERLARTPGSGPRIDLRLDGDLGDLSPAVDAAVYRIVQESATNAVRHAVGATEVGIRVLGGVLDAGPGPGRGWLVEASLPRREVSLHGDPGPRR